MTGKTIESDVVLAQRGDEAAFSRLVSACSNTVTSISLAILRNVEASEDVAQETFIAAWKSLSKLHDPASFLPWLRTVTRNQSHLWRREHQREVSDEAILAAAADNRPSAMDHLVSAEEHRLLREILDEMRDDEREVLVLYYREEHSTHQVASLLGLSEEAVRQRVSRARMRLRDEMLERFGRVVAGTAPGAAFTTAVAAAMTIGAPTASAAIVASNGATALFGAKGSVAAAGLTGTILGWTGVLMGMKWLEPFFDEREERELRRFRNIMLAVVSAGAVVIAMFRSSPMAILISVQSVYAAIIGLYAFMLPRILERRMAWERSVNPEQAKLTRRQWMWATISRAVAAAVGGAVIMAMTIVMST